MFRFPMFYQISLICELFITLRAAVWFLLSMNFILRFCLFREFFLMAMFVITKSAKIFETLLVFQMFQQKGPFDRVSQSYKLIDDWIFGKRHNKIP